MVGREIHFQEFTSGPIPSPEELSKYHDLNPELVNRIVSMAEKEANNRHLLEQKAVDSNVHTNKLAARERIIGQFCGLAIGLATISAGAWIISKGHVWPGALVGSSGVAGLVAVFVYGRAKFDKSE